MCKVTEIFGTNVFNAQVMKNKLPKDIYNALKKTMEAGTHLELDIANVVATAMKEWAIEKGATHFTHWFQPMTGITAEKHDGFITPAADGSVMMQFSGSALVKGEPDASSFPSGGLRSTFEARGYTAWDPSSFAFIKENTLCIPTAFVSYSGEVLDKKTPLLRSMEVINEQALRILKLFGKKDILRVIPTVGAEQEYFLIDKKIFDKRKDLIYCGRTLFGAKAPKGQELEDHYFGALKSRVADFMHELNIELWKLGVLAKMQHNEVAPCQHELAPIFGSVNIAADHNQLTMEVMKRIANKHGLACLLHEKPFAGVNGSGKHNNWSLATNCGVNLLEPGTSPEDNAQFLLFLVAVIKAVDTYANLLRVSVASAGNDHRLGANEAPPAIVSVFLGDELTAILEAIENNTFYDKKNNPLMEMGAIVLPHFAKDTTDRNRTSPFAFTGNKFEFRMPGANFSISGPNVVINTAVAEILSQFAEELEQAQDFSLTLQNLIRDTIKNHKRIIFNGNNYATEWVEEAKKRGLLNLKSTAVALPQFSSPQNIELLTKHKIFTEIEIHSRTEILLENYSKILNIEALTMLEMIRKDFLPAVINYNKFLSDTANSKNNLAQDINTAVEINLLSRLSKLNICLYNKTEELETNLLDAKNHCTAQKVAEHYNAVVFPKMCELRQIVDELETLVARKYWTVPTYSDILLSV